MILEWKKLNFQIIHHSWWPELREEDKWNETKLVSINGITRQTPFMLKGHQTLLHHHRVLNDDHNNCKIPSRDFTPEDSFILTSKYSNDFLKRLLPERNFPAASHSFWSSTLIHLQSLSFHSHERKKDILLLTSNNDNNVLLPDPPSFLLYFIVDCVFWKALQEFCPLLQRERNFSLYFRENNMGSSSVVLHTARHLQEEEETEVIQDSSSRLLLDDDSSPSLLFPSLPLTPDANMTQGKVCKGSLEMRDPCCQLRNHKERSKDDNCPSSSTTNFFRRKNCCLASSASSSFYSLFVIPMFIMLTMSCLLSSSTSSSLRSSTSSVNNSFLTSNSETIFNSANFNLTIDPETGRISLPSATESGRVQSLPLNVSCGSEHNSNVINKSSSPPCKLESVTRLELSHSHKLKVLTHRAFSLLPRLESLILGHNLISRAEETTLQGLESLKRLDLSNNELVALPPRFFQPVTNTLEELLLQNNSISVLPPGLFHGMRQLTELHLAHNEITSHWVGPETFADLINLRTLDLSHNRMTRLDGKTFSSLTSLNLLNLAHNEIDSIPEDSFASLSSLQSLILSHNHLSKIDSSLPLSGLRGLMSLSLDHNGIETIHDQAFVNISSSLFELNLSNNKLKSVPAALQITSNLRSLDLSFNQISSISNTSYQGIEQLYSLNLEGNRIGNLTKGVFSDLPSLRILLLARNRIGHIAQGTFDDVPDLHALRLDSNQISDINGLFGNLRDLLMLNISVNRISWFDYALIPIGLQWLDIHSNNIENLGNYYEMEAVLKLKSLDCSHNRIKEIDSASFPDGIEIIQISLNSLKKIAPFTFMGKQNLTRVDLTDNHLESLDSNAFRLAKTRLHRQLPEFTISRNPYSCDCNMEWLKQVLILDDSKQYPKFVDADGVRCHMTFEGNFIVNNRHYHRNKSAISSSSSSSQLLPPSSLLLSSIPIKDVPSSSFLCQYKSHCFALCHCCDFDACDCEMTCPENCRCYYDASWGNNIVDCSATSTVIHKMVPTRIPMDVTELYLDNNDIHSLSSHTFIGRKNLRVLHLNNSGIHVINNRTFNGLKNLQVLNLDHNHLTQLFGYEFEKLFDLKELYLSYNKISLIANNTFTAMRSLKVLHLDHNLIMEYSAWSLSTSNSRLIEVTLSHNLWSCECKFLKQFTNWLSETKDIVIDSRGIQCLYNDSLSITLLHQDFNVNSSCTSYSPPGKVIAGPASPSLSQGSSFHVPDYVPVFIIAGCLIFLVLVSIIIGGVYRKEVSVWFYSKYGVRLQGRAAASREEEKLFDCFISYSKKDEAFVTQILAPELEYGNPAFRLCLHYRDLPVASGYLSDAIVEAMEASRRSILVISENFLKNEWCRYEFKSAHLEVLRTNQRHKLILIFIGKINAKDFDPDIRFWLKTSTFLQWGEKMFWEKLRYAMPDVSASRKPYPEQTRDMTVAVHI